MSEKNNKRDCHFKLFNFDNFDGLVNVILLIMFVVIVCVIVFVKPSHCKPTVTSKGSGRDSISPSYSRSDSVNITNSIK